MNTPESNRARPKVAILGVTGMIGSAIYNVLQSSCDLVSVYRDETKLQLLYDRYTRSSTNKTVRVDLNDLYPEYVVGFQGKQFGERTQALIDRLKDCDWVINAAGVTKSLANNHPSQTMFINGAIPHILSSAFGKKLIHITTDCVFDGTSGAPYSETSPACPTDLYGLSKSIGEPSASMILRTSTIGGELGTNYGLLIWFLSQTEQSVNGFTNHLWNGVTAHQLGKICARIVLGAIPAPHPGVYHVFSEDISKHDLLLKLRDKLRINIDITAFTAQSAVDRRLTSEKALIRELHVPTIDAMLAEMPVVISNPTR